MLAINFPYLLIAAYYYLILLIYFYYRTKDTLNSGNLLSVINILMQLRKVCNHPNLFEPRPVISPMQSDGVVYYIPSMVWNILDELLESVRDLS